MKTLEKVLLAIVIVLLVAGIYVALRNIDFFNVGEIDVSVSGPVTYVSADMQRIINPLKGRNIFEINLRSLKKTLEAFDGVKEVRIRRFYPSKLIIEVDSSKEWTPVSDVEGWTVEKIDNAHFKVTVPFNGKFAPVAGKVAITSGTARDEIELTQDINFTFEGHTEILEDGSVKVYGDVKSGIVSKDKYRYATMDASVEMHLGAKGTFMMCADNSSDGYEYELEINAPRPKWRLRSNGGNTDYGDGGFDFNLEKANAMTRAQISFVPDADPTKINMSFFCNGEQQGSSLVVRSAFASNAETSTNYTIRTNGDYLADDGSYFIVKSCIITPVE